MSVSWDSINLTTSIPSKTCPNTTCLWSNHGVCSNRSTPIIRFVIHNIKSLAYTSFHYNIYGVYIKTRPSHFIYCKSCGSGILFPWDFKLHLKPWKWISSKYVAKACCSLTWLCIFAGEIKFNLPIDFCWRNVIWNSVFAGQIFQCKYRLTKDKRKNKKIQYLW